MNMKTLSSRSLVLFLSFIAALSLAAADAPKPSPLDAARAAMEKAHADKAAAEKSLAKSEAAAQTAQVEAEKAAAAKAAADRLDAEKSAAQKALADKEAALKAAQETVLAEEAYAADEALKKWIADRTAAEKTLAEKTPAAKKSADEAAAAKRALEKASAEKAAAEKSLNKRLAAVEAALERLTAAKSVAVTGESPEVAAARDACDKAESEKSTAEKVLAEKTAAAKTAADQCASTQAAADKAAAEKAEAEKLVSQKAGAVAPLLDKQSAARAALLGGLKPLPASEWDYAKARHLLWRAGFGGSPDDVAKLHAMGLHNAVDYLVDFQKLPEPTAPVNIRLPERSTPYENRLTATERSKLENERTSRRFAQLNAMRQWWLRRMVETQRPLEEKLTLFWHGIFAVSFQKNEIPYLMYRQNRMFREYGAANYAGLLRGIAQDPAMIAYLDNQSNFKGAGNENLGREILELFSMGEGQGYTEQDLREASRALTGYGYDHPTAQFKFIATRHDETAKRIFGQSGNWGGDDLVDMILKQPATARFVSMRLFKFFVHDEPSAETIDKLAGAMRLCRYELAPVLRNLFLSEEFYSPTAMSAHIKSPVELMIGTLRTVGATEVNYASVDSELQRMGQTLFEPPSVKGWDGGRDWINASRLLIRYNAVSALVDQGAIDLAGALCAKKVCQPEAVVDFLAKGFLTLPLAESKRAELVKFLGTLPPSEDWPKQKGALNARLRAVLAALLSTPEYQLSQSGHAIRDVAQAQATGELALLLPDFTHHASRITFE